MARTQRSIQAFGQVSKPLVDALHASKKRKQPVEDSPSSPEAIVKRTKRTCLQLHTPSETPSKAVKRALANLNLAVPAQPALKTSKRKRAASPALDTPPTRAKSEQVLEESASTELPDELFHLTRLNSSFLTALSLHYAHHGTASPIDVRTLTPSITKIWGKRKVRLEDVRLCLGVMDSKTSNWRINSPSTFTLANYANGKICLELKVSRKQKGVLSQCFDEKALNARFTHRLEQAWTKWATKADLTAFISSLPLAEVPLSASYKKVAPLFAKGQQRLEEVMKPKANNDQSPASLSKPKRRKPNAAEATPTKSKATEETIASKENTNPLAAVEAGIRGMDLLERIRAKEAYKSTLPTPPTKEELARIAALQRAEELLSILDLLASGKGAGLRVSFPLAALVTSVQASIRSPMSKEEIENCLDVLEKDVAAGYVSCVAFGSMKCVVVNKAMKPWPEEVAERLKECGVVV
jgi:hypothetical protein